jgi:rhodanese-related sulfurtransferase
MTMGFEAENPRLLRGLQPGDTIQFILKEQADNRILLVALKKLGRAEGPAASESLTKQLRDVITVGHGTGGPVLAIPPDYAKRLMDEGDRPIFIDLRPVEEFRKGRLPGARSLPISEFRRRLAEVPRTGRVILYCACPPEEIQAGYQYLRDQGYRNLSVMEEGFPGWVKRGYPVER